ncbi:SLATT domain-containing protein, partial [Alkanindiges hydrocarboniclasticus]
WLVTKKHRELSASYRLTAFEISKIKEKFLNISDDKEFEIFVADSENAFSREHTQWLARQDSL